MRLPVSSLPTKDRPALSICDIMSGLTYSTTIIVHDQRFIFPIKEASACKRSLPRIYADVAHQQSLHCHTYTKLQYSIITDEISMSMFGGDPLYLF